ncbi:MAG TPA: endo alpha-1,4 polygalactosaminidase, partial [Halomonas sp.]|nr:endo alpha-1,4 polygalactosaminidase [Halomonas sp.]
MAPSSLSQAVASIRKLVGLLITLFFSLAVVAAPSKPAPASVAFWYADKPPLGELAQFDWVVFEPEHMTPADVSFVVQQGSQPFAYLSIGELADHQAQSDPELLEHAADQVRNPGWNSHVMDLTSAGWRDYIFRRAAEFEKRGYSGLFLDTLDSFTLLAEEQRPAQRDALLALLRDLHQRYPGLKLFVHRGFEVLPDLKQGIAAVAVESIHASWDARGQVYRPVPEEDRAWLTDQLRSVRERNIPIVAIDYLPADRRAEARELAGRLIDEGYVPYISTPGLDTLGVGSIEVQPRRIAVLYDPREGELTRTGGFRSLGGLLEYMGYRVDYLPADASLPTSAMTGLYAGAIVWMTSGVPPESAKFNRWIDQRLDEGTPLAFFQGLPIDDAAILTKLGLQRNGAQPVTGLELVRHDQNLIGEFEAPLVVRSRGLIAIGNQANANTAALVLADAAGRQHTPVVTGEWG